MILGSELKNDIVSLLCCDLGRIEGKRTAITNKNLDIGSCYNAGSGSNSGKRLEELHFVDVILGRSSDSTSGPVRVCNEC